MNQTFPANPPEIEEDAALAFLGVDLKRMFCEIIEVDVKFGTLRARFRDAYVSVVGGYCME